MHIKIKEKRVLCILVAQLRHTTSSCLVQEVILAWEPVPSKLMPSEDEHLVTLIQQYDTMKDFQGKREDKDTTLRV